MWGSIEAAIGHLPSSCTAALDLGVVEAVSAQCALALVDRFAHGPRGRLELIVAAGEPAVRVALVDAGLERVATLVHTLDEARRMAGSRPPALLRSCPARAGWTSAGRCGRSVICRS